MEIKIMIAGSGGQGILFLGRLICQAAMLEGKDVTWFPSYGAEMRGGTANCTVVISDSLIGSPIVKSPDIMIILNMASIEKFLSRIRVNGKLFYDSSLITKAISRNDISVFPVPSSKLAGQIGSPRLSNMVLLGAFATLNGIASKESIRNALEMTVPPHRSSLIEKNLLAIKRGSEFAKHQESSN